MASINQGWSHTKFLKIVYDYFDLSLETTQLFHWLKWRIRRDTPFLLKSLVNFTETWGNGTNKLYCFQSGQIWNSLFIWCSGSGALANVVANYQGHIGSAPLISATVAALLSILVVNKAFTENAGTSSNVWRPLDHALQSLSGLFIFPPPPPGSIIHVFSQAHVKYGVDVHSFSVVVWVWSSADKKVLLLGWTQVCFDFSVIIFWFLWTPTLVVSLNSLSSLPDVYQTPVFRIVSVLHVEKGDL